MTNSTTTIHNASINWKYLMLYSMGMIILMTYFSQSVLITKERVFNFYAGQLNYDQIEALLQAQSKWAIVGYAIGIVFYLLKICLITSCIYVGLFFIGNYKIGFIGAMKRVVKADLVSLVPMLIKIGWFTFIQSKFSLKDVQFFSPLSLFNFFEIAKVDPWFIYPLQAFNVFEVLFWVILAFEFKPLFKNEWNKSFQLVAMSYGSGFVLWNVLIVFLTISLT